MESIRASDWNEYETDLQLIKKKKFTCSSGEKRIERAGSLVKDLNTNETRCVERGISKHEINIWKMMRFSYKNDYGIWRNGEGGNVLHLEQFTQVTTNLIQE